MINYRIRIRKPLNKDSATNGKLPSFVNKKIILNKVSVHITPRRNCQGKSLDKQLSCLITLKPQTTDRNKENINIK